MGIMKRNPFPRDIVGVPPDGQQPVYPPRNAKLGLQSEKEPINNPKIAFETGKNTHKGNHIE
jgi:hypothetical protein